MTERPDLTYETFLVLARQQGFEMDDDHHLLELFSEVQSMFQRIRLLEPVDTSGVRPVSGLSPVDWTPTG